MEEKEIMSYDDAFYLDVGTSQIPDIQLMNVGVTSMEETSNPTEKSRQYIGDKSVTNTVTGYDNQWAIDNELIKNNAVMDYLFDIFRKRKTGTEAQTDLYIVETWNGDAGAYVARKIRVSAIMDTKTNTPGENVTFSGTLKGVGDFKYGTFNLTTKTFTEDIPSL